MRICTRSIKGAAGLVVSLSLFCGYFGWKALMPKRYKFFSDGQLSSEVLQRLEFGAMDFKNQWISHSKLSSQIEKLCPVLKNISIKYTPQLVACLMVETARPLGIFNNEYVLTEHRKIVSVDDYCQFSIRDLPQITAPSLCLENNSSFIDDYFTFFSAMCPEAYEQFQITIYDQNYIELAEKNTSKWLLLVTAKNNIDTTLLEKYKHIQSQHLGDDNKKYIDMRFEGMAVYGVC